LLHGIAKAKKQLSKLTISRLANYSTNLAKLWVQESTMPRNPRTPPKLDHGSRTCKAQGQHLGVSEGTVGIIAEAMRDGL
jgi:hypothetical protein